MIEEIKRRMEMFDERDGRFVIPPVNQFLRDREKKLTEAVEAEREACAMACERQAELQSAICADERVINQSLRCAADIRRRTA